MDTKPDPFLKLSLELHYLDLIAVKNIEVEPTDPFKISEGSVLDSAKQERSPETEEDPINELNDDRCKPVDFGPSRGSLEDQEPELPRLTEGIEDSVRVSTSDCRPSIAFIVGSRMLGEPPARSGTTLGLEGVDGSRSTSGEADRIADSVTVDEADVKRMSITSIVSSLI